MELKCDHNCNLSSKTGNTTKMAIVDRVTDIIRADARRDEVAAIRSKFPTKVPLIVQRYCKEKSLPLLDKTKFLVPQEITMSQFLVIIRNRMKILPTQAVYLLIDNRSMLSMSQTMAQAYADHKNTDGFLYITYASQEMFGRDETIVARSRTRAA